MECFYSFVVEKLAIILFRHERRGGAARPNDTHGNELPMPCQVKFKSAYMHVLSGHSTQLGPIRTQSDQTRSMFRCATGVPHKKVPLRTCTAIVCVHITCANGNSRHVSDIFCKRQFASSMRAIRIRAISKRGFVTGAGFISCITREVAQNDLETFLCEPIMKTP